MSWNYRIVSVPRPGGVEFSYAIHEAYYPGDVEDQFELDRSKPPTSICVEPHDPFGLSITELRRDLNAMRLAFDYEPLDGTPFQIRLRYERRKSKTVADDMNRLLRVAQTEAYEWKKAYAKANSDRLALENQLNMMKKLVREPG